MPSRHKILLVSRSREAADQLYECLSEAHDLEIEKRVVSNGQADPLHGLVTLPDMLVLQIGPESSDELEALTHYTPSERPPLIVIGDGDDAKNMRAAMQAGARDFLSEPITEEDLMAAVRRLTIESKPARKPGTTEMIAFVNAKGGSGASFLSANIAHLLASLANRRTALVDLDLQFGNLPQYLDLKPKRGLIEALDVAEDLDGVAIEAYMTKHETGLSILASLNAGVSLHQELMTEGFDTILDLLAENYERVVVDMPRQIDQFSALTLERADRVIMVTQQSVPSLHNAVRMYEILTKELSIPSDRVMVVVNRVVKNASVELSDIAQALHGLKPIAIPNDYQAVNESINIGVPIFDHSRRSAVTKALLRLEEQLDGRPATRSRGFMTRLRGVAG